MAIDVGYKNFAWCVVDNFSRPAPILHQRQALWHLKRPPQVEEIVDITRAWALAHDVEIAKCDYVVLERQLRPLYIAMNVVLQTMYYDKVLVVHPSTVGAYWGLPRKREEKKKAGVQLVLEAGVPLPKGKADDLADAWLMAAYQMIGCGVWNKTEFHQ